MMPAPVAIGEHCAVAVRRSVMTFLQIVIPLYLFDLSVISALVAKEAVLSFPDHAPVSGITNRYCSAILPDGRFTASSEVQLIQTQRPHAEERATRASRSMGSKRFTYLAWSVLDQLHPLQARVSVLADDDVVVDGNAERGGDLDDRLRHVDVGLRRRRIGGGVVVHQDQRGRR